jgi:hypothetical protein
MSDDDVLASVGTPKLAGPSQHHAVLKATICKVARLSVFHAQQVRDVIGWGVEFQAHADASATTSYFQSSTSSEDSAAEGTDGAHGADAGGLFLAQDVDETLLSHEMGHAVFHNHKFAAPMEAAVKSAGLADTQKYGQVTAVINEAFANFFAERAAVYMRTQRSQKEWDAWTSHSLGHGFDWILENGDGTTNFWFTSLDCTQATVDAKPLITKTADGVVFPRLAELYNLDQKREYAP